MLERVTAILGCLLGALACSVQAGDDGPQGTACTPGAPVSCSCLDGALGTAVCQAGGVVGPCTCGAATDGSGASSSGSGSSGGSGCATSGCADSGTSSSSESGDCSATIYAGKFDGMPVPWVFQGEMGLAAGNAACASLGADHVCEYQEVRAAEAADELAGLVNTFAWVHRETIEDVEAVPSAPGPGGRCVDWTDGTGMFADGEWLEFTAQGVVYHLDADTFYDGLDSSHTDAMSLPCANIMRSVLCCNTAC